MEKMCTFAVGNRVIGDGDRQAEGRSVVPPFQVRFKSVVSPFQVRSSYSPYERTQNEGIAKAERTHNGSKNFFVL